MNDNFLAYLHSLSIPLGEKLHAKIASLYDIAVGLSHEPIEDIFVSNQIDAEGRQLYISLFFWTPSFLLESKNIMAMGPDNNIDICAFRGNVRYCEMFWIKYDFKRATSDSRFRARLHFLASGGCEFFASGANCDVIYHLYQKYTKSLRT
jgi:hypothetical protein